MSHPAIARLTGHAGQAQAAAVLAAQCLTVNEYAPDFELPRADGTTVSLERMLQRGPVALWFVHGAWCRQCREELERLRSLVPVLAARRVALAGIVPTPPPVEGTGGELLIDADAHVANLYGNVLCVPEELVRAAVDAGLELPYVGDCGEHGLPVPAAFVINALGIVTFAAVDPDHRRGPRLRDLLAEFGVELDQRGASFETAASRPPQDEDRP